MAEISIIMATYNRAKTLPRAIDSVLAQDFADWELIIVDDGSTDNTPEILANYTDPRIRCFYLGKNRGPAVARNTGYDKMTGEWFTALDSDDEILPNALSTLLQVPQEIDSSVDAITCNCLDTRTGEFSGEGLDRDGWLDFETLVTKCSGEHWGITKRSLLGDLRFNEKLRGAESVIWYKISPHAKRYYINKALRIYHTEGEDRLCAKTEKVDLDAKSLFYLELAKEKDYREILRKYRLSEYDTTTFYIAMSYIITGQRKQAFRMYRDSKGVWSMKKRTAFVGALVLGSTITRLLAIQFARAWRR